MTTSQPVMDVVALTSEQLDRYASMARPETIQTAMRRVEEIGRDLVALRATGDEDALRGATTLLQLALLQLAAIPVTSIRKLERKQQCLSAHAEGLEATWLVDPMVGTALRMDYESLDLSPEQESRLRAMLPLERA